MGGKEDFQKYRIMDENGVPMPEERYHVAVSLEGASLHACPSNYIIRRTHMLDAEVEMLRLGTCRGVRFLTGDSPGLNLLRLSYFAVLVNDAVKVRTSGPDGWKALREILHVLSQQDVVRGYRNNRFNPLDSERGMAERMYAGYMMQGVDEDADVEREMWKAQLLLLGSEGRKKARELTSVACTRCSKEDFFTSFMIVPPDFNSVWAGDTLCDSCCRDLALEGALPPIEG